MPRKKRAPPPPPQLPPPQVEEEEIPELGKDFHYAEAVNSNFECPVCCEPWFDPVEYTPCEHVLCRRCAVALDPVHMCPTCRGMATELGPPGRFMRVVLDELKVCCCRCGWTNERSELISHLRHCAATQQANAVNTDDDDEEILEHEDVDERTAVATTSAPPVAVATRSGDVDPHPVKRAAAKPAGKKAKAVPTSQGGGSSSGKATGKEQKQQKKPPSPPQRPQPKKTKAKATASADSDDEFDQLLARHQLEAEEVARQRTKKSSAASTTTRKTMAQLRGEEDEYPQPIDEEQLQKDLEAAPPIYGKFIETLSSIRTELRKNNERFTHATELRPFCPFLTVFDEVMTTADKEDLQWRSDRGCVTLVDSIFSEVQEMQQQISSAQSAQLVLLLNNIKDLSVKENTSVEQLSPYIDLLDKAAEGEGGSEFEIEQLTALQGLQSAILATSEKLKAAGVATAEEKDDSSA